MHRLLPSQSVVDMKRFRWNSLLFVLLLLQIETQIDFVLQLLGPRQRSGHACVLFLVGKISVCPAFEIVDDLLVGFFGLL